MAQLTPSEFAILLDLVGKVQLPVGVVVNQLQPILARAVVLASADKDARIGVLPTDPPVPAGTSGNGVIDAQTRAIQDGP